MFQSLKQEDNFESATTNASSMHGNDKSANLPGWIGQFCDWAFNGKINAGNAQACENINHY